MARHRRRVRDTEVLAWYERLARGRPGAIVVEATGIRDVASGPLLRIGDARFIPGLKSLADTVHRASGGETRLYIQLIDFLSVRRRPDPERFLMRFLVITKEHRCALAMPDAPEDQVRASLVSLSPAQLAGVLTAREFEALEMGARERITDTELPQIAALPQAGHFTRSAMSHHKWSPSISLTSSQTKVNNNPETQFPIGKIRLLETDLQIVGALL
jgi:hypothetical protein